MGLDVRVRAVKAIICHHCGERAGHDVIYEYYSGGNVWYPFLEKIGYYVPPEARVADDDGYHWYQKDMVLTAEQRHELLTFVDKHHEEIGNADFIHALIIGACAFKNDIAINADW